MNNQHVRVQVWGKVQGVGFRASARAEARELGMRVVAENQSDGTVLLEASGTPRQMESFLHWVHHGPRHARVDRVEVTPISADSET